MPVIELQKKRTNRDRGYKPLPNTPNKWAQEVYASSLWRKLRESHLMKEPLCRLCQEKGIIRPATEVHHIMHISQAGSRLEALDIGYDSDNLMSLCKECHQRIHADKHRKINK